MNRFFFILSASITCMTYHSRGQLAIYSYTGATANQDSSITAWFEFDTSAMWDRGVRFTEILNYSFLVTGTETNMNGQYELLLGGGIGFGATSPGSSNLPIIQSLVIQNTQTGSIIMSDNFGDPGIFVGGTLGIGPPVYSGSWTFEAVPEPTVISLLGLTVCMCWSVTRRSRKAKSTS
jgi:hypothetical protein